MNKMQLGTGLAASLMVLAILTFLAFALQERSRELHPSTFAALGWASGIAGMFVAGSCN